LTLSRVSESEERALIEAAQQDPGRFAELYEHNFDRVYAYIVVRIHDRSEAQDLTAHVFQQALANIGKFKWRGAPFIAWLYRIAANAMADRARKKSREPGETEVATIDTVATINNVDSNLEQVERRARLFSAVESLPEDQRRVILLRFGEEQSTREIAAALNRSEGAVKQLQFRGLENLRARLRE
jgi:RNA polymerase sigma-70 factor (ECF subfamily)